MGVRSRRIRISSTTSGPRRSASSGWAISSSKRVTASTMASVERPTYSPRCPTPWERRAGRPARQVCHARGIQIQDEAEIRILSAGPSHLAGDRQIHREDQQMRGIVLEHLAAEHDHLRTLRRDAQGRAQRGVDGLGRHPRQRGWHRCPGAGAETRRRAGCNWRADWRVVGGPARWEWRASCPRRRAGASSGIRQRRGRRGAERMSAADAPRFQPGWVRSGGHEPMVQAARASTLPKTPAAAAICVRFVKE